MGDRRDIGLGVSENEVPTLAHGVGTDGQPLAINRMSLQEARHFAANTFDQAVIAWGKADAFCMETDTDKGTLSDMRHGRRPVQAHLLIWTAREPEAAKIVVARQAEVAGFAVPHRRDTIRLHTDTARLLAFMRRVGFLRIFGSIIAAEFYGCDLDVLQEAIDLALIRTGNP